MESLDSKERKAKCNTPHYPVEFRGLIEGKESIITIYFAEQNSSDIWHDRSNVIQRATILAIDKGWRFCHLLDRVDVASPYSVLESDLSK